jgi:hypothetical protein
MKLTLRVRTQSSPECTQVKRRIERQEEIG